MSERRISLANRRLQPLGHLTAGLQVYEIHALTVKDECSAAVRVVVAVPGGSRHTPGHTALDLDAIGENFRGKRTKGAGSTVADKRRQNPEPC
jgi:hypothetical protein